MELVLRIVLFIMSAGVFLAGKAIYHDWDNVRKTDGFDNITPWEKIKFHSTFLTILSSVSCFLVFMSYILLSKITITFPLW